MSTTDRMQEIPDSAWQIVSGGGTVALLGLFARWILRQLARDKVAAVADRSEVTQIARLEGEIKRVTERLLEERARADQAYLERNQAIEKAAIAIGEVRGLRTEIERLEQRIKALEELLKGFYGINPK
jgi:uncharacterized protein (UPF0335 family)